MKRRTDVHLKQAKQKETNGVSRRESQEFNETETVTPRQKSKTLPNLWLLRHNARPTARSFPFPSYSYTILTQARLSGDFHYVTVLFSLRFLRTLIFPSVLKRRPRSGAEENKRVSTLRRFL